MYFCTRSFCVSMRKFFETKFCMDLLDLLLYYCFLIVMDFSSGHLPGDIKLNTESTTHDSDKCLSVFHCNLNSLASNH